MKNITVVFISELQVADELQARLAAGETEAFRELEADIKQKLNAVRVNIDEVAD